MRAAARFTTIGAATLHVLEERESAYTKGVQQVLNTLGVGLIIYDHYTFEHTYFLFFLTLIFMKMKFLRISSVLLGSSNEPP